VHSARRSPQRGSNAHPGGSALSYATVPGIGSNFFFPNEGEAASNPYV